MKKIKINTDQRFINVLLLYSGLTDEVGLLCVKIGITVLFYRLVRKSRNAIDEDHAGQLLDPVFKANHITRVVDFSKLTGIGWGLKYLVKNGSRSRIYRRKVGQTDTLTTYTIDPRPFKLKKHANIAKFVFEYG